MARGRPDPQPVGYSRSGSAAPVYHRLPGTGSDLQTDERQRRDGRVPPR